MTRLTTRMLILGALIISALGVSAIGATAKVTPAKAKPVIVKSGTTTVTPSKATLTFLGTHSILPKAIAPAKITPKAQLQFPVSGGTVTAAKLTVIQAGKLQLVTAKKTDLLSKFTFIKAGKTAQLFAVINGSKTTAVATVAKLVIKHPSKKTETISGELRLTKAGAALLNKLAGVKTVKPGFDFGKASTSLKLA